MNKLLYVSTTLPKEEVERLREKQFDFSSNAIMPISVFHGNILAGMADIYDEVTALSGVPISHKNFKIFRYPTKKLTAGKVRFQIGGFFNLPLIKQLTTVCKTYFGILHWTRANKDHHLHIIIDGTYFLGIIALWLASKTRKINTAAIIVDYYPFMDPTLNGKSQRLYYKFLSAVDRFVFVTDHLQKIINRDQKPYMIMEGLVAYQKAVPAPCPIEKVCLYAGGLHELYGVKNLVDAFHQTALPYALHLYGNGDLLDYIKQLQQKDPRIEYKGIVDHDQLLELERSAKLLINPRPVYGKLDTRFNFPSKLMEFMQSGRPVVTTKLLGIPADYSDKMFFFEEDSVEAIKQKIEEILSMDEAQLAAFGQTAADYVNKEKNNVATAQRIYNLFQN